MNQEQRAALRKLAEEATPGPWKASVLGIKVTDSTEQVICRPSAYINNAVRQVANARHIAAANPSTILQLLDYIETLEKDAARYRSVFDDDLAAMKEPLFNAKTGEELPEVRWTIWWIGPNKTLIRDAIDASMQGETE